MVSGVVPMGEVSYPGDDEELLLARCRIGDRAALRELYERNVRMVMGMARRLGAPAAEMEDVAQDVFAAAFRDIARVRSGALSVWLFKLTSHRVNDRHRRHRVREAFAKLWHGSGASEADWPEQALLRGDATRRVERILARMSRKKREVFALFELQGLPGRRNRLSAGHTARYRLVAVVARAGRVHEDRPLARAVRAEPDSWERIAMNRRALHEDSAADPRPLTGGGAQSLEEQAASKLLGRYAVPEPDDLTIERVWQRLANPVSSWGDSRRRLTILVMTPAVLAWVVLLGFIVARGPAFRAHPQAVQPAAVTRSAQLGAARGGVFFSRPAEHWQPGRIGQVLAESERLRSDPSGMAVLEVPGVASVLIASGTDVAIDRLNAGTFLRLSRGSIIARVSKRPPGDPFVILTDRFAVKVVGTLFQVDQDGTGRTAVAVREGTVEVTSADGRAWRVQAGQRWVSSEPGQLGASAIDDSVKTLLEDGLRRGARPTWRASSRRWGGCRPRRRPASPGQVLRRCLTGLPGRMAGTARTAGTVAAATLPRFAAKAAGLPPAPVPPAVLLAEREPIARGPQSAPSEQPAVQPSVAPAPTPAPTVAVTPGSTTDSAYANGLALERRGELNAAAGELARADEEDPSHADLALYALGRLFQHRLNNPHGALAAFERYRSRYPQGALMPEVDLAVLEIEVQTGDRKDALAESIRFLASHPASERTDEVRLLRGNLLREGGDCRMALGEYAEVTAPAFSEAALYGTARCQLRLGDAAAARDALRAYQKRFPAGAHRDEVQRELADESTKPFGSAGPREVERSSMRFLFSSRLRSRRTFSNDGRNKMNGLGKCLKAAMVLVACAACSSSIMQVNATSTRRVGGHRAEWGHAHRDRGGEDPVIAGTSITIPPGALSAPMDHPDRRHAIQSGGVFRSPRQGHRLRAERSDFREARDHEHSAERQSAQRLPDRGDGSRGQRGVAEDCAR